MCLYPCMCSTLHIMQEVCAPLSLLGRLMRSVWVTLHNTHCIPAGTTVAGIAKVAPHYAP